MRPQLIIIILIIFIPVLLAHGFWIFNDARKRGEKYYWIWGLFGLLNTPGNLIIYLIITRIIIDKYVKENKK
jgi:hypothetical protein